MTEVDGDDTKPGVDATFCYLGDMLCSGGACDSPIAARCCVVGESSESYCLSSPPGALPYGAWQSVHGPATPQIRK